MVEGRATHDERWRIRRNDSNRALIVEVFEHEWRVDSVDTEAVPKRLRQRISMTFEVRGDGRVETQRR